MLTINRKYKDDIQQVCKAASEKAVNKVYENICISLSQDGIITLKAGDSVTQVSKMIVADSFTETLSISVNASKFFNAFNACNGDVTIMYSVKTGDVIIKSGNRMFKLPTVSYDNYPLYQDSGDLTEVTCDDFIEKIKAVSWSSARDDVRYQFNGVYVGKHAVATDGFRMCMKSINVDKNMIIPIDAVNKIPPLEDYTIKVSSNILSITTQDMEFKTILIDGRYPDYTRVLGKPDKFVNVNIPSLIDAISASMVTVDKKINAVSLNFDIESFVSSSSKSKETSSIPFDCSVDCDPFVFSVNASYLLSALKTIDSEYVDLGFDGVGKVIINHNDCTIVVMEVKL